ncbi:unnamed protein product [Cunninghamella echinulata]
MTYLAVDSGNSKLYEYRFFTNKQIYDDIKQQLPKLKKVISQYQFSLLLKKHKETIGDVVKKRIDGELVRGRYINLKTRPKNEIKHSEVLYISYSSYAHIPILSRDHEATTNKILGDGTTQDYAGLSTIPDDIRNALDLYKRIKEIVVIHKADIEVLERGSLLRGNDAISKFDCRKGFVQRSK